MLFLPEYSMYYAKVNARSKNIEAAEPCDGAFIIALGELCRRYGLWIAAGMYERTDGLPYNTIAVLDDRGRLRGTHRKRRLYDAFGYRESDKCRAGDKPFSPIETPVGKLGIITCFELRFPTLAAEQKARVTYDNILRISDDVTVMRDGQCVFEAQAMNDVVVNRGSTSGMVELRIEVGGSFVSNQRADGLIVATPTGSTAYALSAGGPMLHPSIPAWVMVPIAPHNLSNRPIVLSDATEVAVEVVSGRDVSANFDMQSLASLLHGDRILVKRSEHRVRFLHPQGWNYFATLRKKLRWNEGGS